MPEGNVLREIVQQVKLVYHLMLDPRVHPLAKLIPIAAVAYVVSPVELIPAAISPVLGQMDDVAVFMLGLRMFFEVSPPEVVREYLRRLTRPVTDGEWKVTQTPPGGAPPEPPAPEPPQIVEGAFKPFTFEGGLVNRIINDAGDRPDQLPLIQHALLRTWQQAERTRATNDGTLPLEVDDYTAVGAIQRALSNHADEAIELAVVALDVGLLVAQDVTGGPRPAEM